MSDKLCLRLKISRLMDDIEGVDIIKNQAGYGYKYADLDAITRVLSPLLKEHGIGYFHRTDFDITSGNNIVVTTVFSKDDPKDDIECRTLIDRTVKLAKMNQFMVEGSAITYFRRYHLVAIFGLITDEDTDAGGKRDKSKPAPPTGGGRSVEAASNESSVDYVNIFKDLMKSKTKAQVNKTFDLYKKQMTDDQINQVTKLITEKYEN